MTTGSNIINPIYKGLDNHQIREYNCQVVMNLLYRSKGMSKSQLAQAMQLSIPAISNIINDLIAQDQIENIASLLKSKGNYKGIYKVASNRPNTICLNISPTCIQALMVDHEISQCSDFINQPITLTTPKLLIDDVVSVIQYCQQTNSMPEQKSKPYRLAIAVHGQVDSRTGVSMQMPQAPWTEHIELKYILEQRLNVHVLVDNDCVMIALAEKWLDDHNSQDFCVLNIDYGIGSSFLIKNHIYRGKMFGSGQIGHTKVTNNGIICGCGREGCLETESSSKAICEKYAKLISTATDSSASLPFDQFLLRYNKNDSIAQKVVNHAANTIGTSLYNFLITLNINKIILYGNTCELGQSWLDAITQQTLVNPFEDKAARSQDQTIISFGKLSHVEQLMGISYLWVERDLM